MQIALLFFYFLFQDFPPFFFLQILECYLVEGVPDISRFVKFLKFGNIFVFSCFFFVSGKKRRTIWKRDVR